MAKVNRFSASFLETVAGPVPGALSELHDLLMKARNATVVEALSDEEAFKLKDYLNFFLYETPLLNLFYVRPALDFLFLNSMREVASPGFMKRSHKRAIEITGNKHLRYLNRSRKDGGIW